MGQMVDKQRTVDAQMFHFVQISASTRPLYLDLGLVLFFSPSHKVLTQLLNVVKTCTMKNKRKSKNSAEMCGQPHLGNTPKLFPFFGEFHVLQARRTPAWTQIYQKKKTS